MKKNSLVFSFKFMEIFYNSFLQNISDVSPQGRMLFQCLKGLYKTFWGTTKKCENKNLT